MSLLDRVDELRDDIRTGTEEVDTELDSLKQEFTDILSSLSDQESDLDYLETSFTDMGEISDSLDDIAMNLYDAHTELKGFIERVEEMSNKAREIQDMQDELGDDGYS